MKLRDTHFFIIGVPGRYRGRTLEENLITHGASYERVEGIDGQSMPISAFENATDSRVSRLLLGRELTKGEYGCANAHLLAYKKIIESDHTWAIVLEDDAELSIDFIQQLDQIEVKSNKARVVQLYGIDVYRSQIRDHPWFLNMIDRRSCEGNLIDIGRYWEYPERTHGYLINKTAAAIAVRTMEAKRILTPADWPHEWRKFITFSISLNQLVGLSQESSMIEIERRRSERASAFVRFISFVPISIGLMNLRQRGRNKVVLRCMYSVLKSQLLNAVYRFQRAAVRFTKLKSTSKKKA